MISIEQESGNSVLIDMHGIPERGSLVIFPLFGDMEVLEKLLGDIESDVEVKFSEESLDEFFKNAEDIHLRVFADDELRVWPSCLVMGAKDNFSYVLVRQEACFTIQSQVKTFRRREVRF